jgi:hypothetical protein
MAPFGLDIPPHVAGPHNADEIVERVRQDGTSPWRAVVSRSCPTYFAGGIIGRCSAICVIDP